MKDPGIRLHSVCTYVLNERFRSGDVMDGENLGQLRFGRCDDAIVRLYVYIFSQYLRKKTTTIVWIYEYVQ